MSTNGLGAASHANGPEFDGAIGAAREDLLCVGANEKSPHVVRVTSQLTNRLTCPGIPHADEFVGAAGHENGSGWIHGQTVDAVLLVGERRGLSENTGLDWKATEELLVTVLFLGVKLRRVLTSQRKMA